MQLLKKYEAWNVQRIARHVVYWFTWASFYVLTNWLSNRDESFKQWLLFELSVLPIKLLFTYIVAYGLMPKYLYKKKIVPFSISFFGSLLVSGYLLFLVYEHVVQTLIFEDLALYKADQFIYKGIELVYIASIFIGFKFFQNYQHEVSRNNSLTQEKIEAELKYLKNQINPHFLFNTLNNIYGMILSDKKDLASDTIVEFSNLLSYMLYESNVPKVSLAKELNHLDSFIKLESLRYEKRLQLDYKKSTINSDLSIAPLLLVPLVENAFKHGPAKLDKGAKISISVRTDHNNFHFEIENSYKKQQFNDEITSGIGLKNVKKRLKLIYPDRHQLTIEPGEFFKVSLHINLSAND